MNSTKRSLLSDGESSPQYWIEHLEMERHPEGGYYRELYRSTESIAQSALPARFPGPRNCCTSIVYLLEAGDFSAFHRIRSDETWHFYAGGPLDLHILVGGEHNWIQIGNRLHLGQHLQWTVPAEAWFASRPAAGSNYSLLGCTVSPGFDFEDFQMAERGRLLGTYPAQAELICQLTRSAI